MPKKKTNPLQIEQKEYRIFDPEKVKQTVEVPEKPKPAINDLITIEKPGKQKKDKIKKLSSKGYSLIITEKPQAASKIASALSEGKEKKLSNNGVPYFELENNNKKIIVACAVGHLFTVSQTIRGTSYPVFDIKWYPNFEIKKKDFTKKYYLTIQKLVKGASEIIIATDFDVEGEVIGYNIIRFIAGQKDAKRMKFSSLTAKEIQESFKNLHPTIEWGQAIAGETRHFIDWLYGINLSRALMQAIKSVGKFRIMSIGRVQGPALNLIVEKETEISKFKSTPYWQIFIKITNNKDTTELKYIKDITKKSDLSKFENLAGKTAIAKTTKSKQIISPPASFDLTTLQTESYKFYSITPSQTLQIAQNLYLQGLISYPRTSSQKIPESMKPLEILKKLSKHFNETEHATKKIPVEGKKSDPAHPAIIPTGNYQNLESHNRKIYELIVKRFISCFCENAELENKKIELEIEGLRFSKKGMEIINHGWMNVYPTTIEEKEIKDFNGEIIIEKIRVEEKMTQPPKRYSPASIVTELEKRNLGTKCLSEDTRIIINGNLMSMRELFEKGEYFTKEGKTEIRKINGTTISLSKEKIPIFSSPKLISKRKIENNENLLEIETDASILRLTDDHPIYIYDNNKIKLIKVKNLSINDNAIGIFKNYDEGKILIEKSLFNNNFIIKNNEIKHKFSSKTSKGISISKFPVKWSNSLAWVLGYYYGDGSYSNPKYNGSHQLCFTTTEKKALELLRSNIKKIFGVEPYEYDLKGKYKLNLNCVMSYALIKAFPELEGKKLIKIPKKLIGSFLKGFFDADGNVHLRPLGKIKIKGINCNSFDTPRVKITLANKELIYWISNLLKELTIENKVNKTLSSCRGKKFDSWTILIAGRDKIERFAYKIGFDSYKEDILYKGLKCNSLKYKVLKNSALISLLLNQNNLKIEELQNKTNLSKYDLIIALKRMFKLGIINKKRYSQANRHLYSLEINDKEYLIHCMKLIYNKISKDLYEIPIRRIEKINYNNDVYDLSIEENSPNFIVEGNILIHNSTRANIIETLYDRNYIKDKSIHATTLGIRLIDSLKKYSPIIIDEKLTRDIETEMENIRSSKKDLEKKENHVINRSKEALTKISKDFKEKQEAIGKELVEANNSVWEQEKEDNNLNIKCPSCNSGKLIIKFSPRFKNYFIACTNYPECKHTFSLPSKSLIKKADKICPDCNFPMVISIRKEKRPWIFCFNPDCPSKKK
jgi:DNA topoisomerase-1